MPDQKHVAPTFVNTLAIHGFLNGVVNLGFATAHWHVVVAQEGKAVVANHEPITADIRMDLHCAISLRDALDKIIDEQTKAKALDS